MPRSARASRASPRNEASYQRYFPEGNGLPPHRDQRYYGFCIAIVTLQGAARFAIHASRETDDVIAQWTTCPGEVILLRGWQSRTDSDPRVDPPADGPRLMFQIRHNLAATTPPSPLLSTLCAAEIDQATQQAGLPPAPLTPQPPRKEASAPTVSVGFRAVGSSLGSPDATGLASCGFVAHSGPH